MENKEFYINDGDVRLHAKLDFPAGIGDTCPLAIMFHGFTGHMEEPHFHAMKRAILASGTATLRVELYGHGLSDGAFEDHTLYKWINNALAVIAYVRRLNFVTDLYLTGHSQGGLLAILIAGMYRDVFKAVLPISPALIIPEGAREGNLLGIPFDPVHVPDMLVREDGLRLKGEYIRAAQCLYPEYQIRAYKGPVLIVHADTDETVPVEGSIKAAEQYSQCELVIIKNDTHCFDHHMDEMETAVEDFMKGMTGCR